MGDFEDMSDRDERQRDPKPGEYSIEAVGGVGRIACYRPGLQLIDFYRTSPVLASDIPVQVAEVTKGKGSALAETQGTRTGGSTPPTGATPENMKNNQ